MRPTRRENFGVWRARHSAWLYLLVALFLGLGLQTAFSVNCQIEIPLRSSAAGIAEVYFDTGAGFNRKERSAVRVTPTTSAVILVFSLPDGNRIKALRFDPLNGPGSFEIGPMIIKAPDHHILRRIDVSSYRVRQQLQVQDVARGRLEARTPVGFDDPSLFVSLNPALVLPGALNKEAGGGKGNSPVPDWPVWMDVALTVLALAILVRSVLPSPRWSWMFWRKGERFFASWGLQWLDRLAERVSDEGLIVFSRSSLLVLLSAAFLFLIFCAFGLHGSSTSLWDYHVAEEAPQHGLLWGEPKQIRSDEISVFTPDIFSQLYSSPALSPVNRTVGGKQAVLFWSQPVRHFVDVPRILMWPFHIFKVDTAFSIYWNLKGLILFIGVYGLLLLVTGSRPWLSAAGTIWVYFSGYTQWWYSHCLPEDIGFAALVLLGGIYAVLSRKVWLMRIGALVLLVSLLNFALIFYPPYAIPIMWVMLAVGFGLFFEKRQLLFGSDPLKVRWLYLFGAASIVVLFLAAFFIDTRQTIEMIRDTVYPGHRFETGGSGSIRAIFSGLIDFTFQEKAIPDGLGNICEGANFYLIGILVLPMIFIPRKGSPAISLVDVCLGILILGMLWFILLGFPSWLAGASLLSTTTTGRVRVGIGLAAVILIVRHLARHSSKLRPDAGDWQVTITILGLLAVAYAAFQASSGFELQGHTLVMLGIVTAALVISAVAGLARPFLAMMLAVLLSHNFLINPVARGFSAITKKNLYRSVRALEKREPDAIWAVIGSFQLANFLKFAGVEVVNGNKFYPVESFNDALDPKHKYIKVWNRYAHIIFADDPSCQEPRYELIRGLLYRVRVSVESPALARTGVRFLLFTYPPPTAYRNAIVKSVQDGGKTFWILRRDLLPSYPDSVRQ